MDVIWDAGATLTAGPIHVAGPDTGPYLANLGPGTRIAGVRFRPGTAPSMLGIPADALRDTRVPLTDLWSGEARRLAEALTAAPDPEESLEAFVVDRLRMSTRPDPAVPVIVRWLSAVPDQRLTVSDLAETLGLSVRQLHRRCLASFGYGPKTLQRILRFHRAVTSAQSGPPSFAGIASATGFADQAHLAREVRQLAGVPLSQLVR